jgi:hypothetical protein
MDKSTNDINHTSGQEGAEEHQHVGEDAVGQVADEPGAAVADDDDGAESEWGSPECWTSESDADEMIEGRARWEADFHLFVDAYDPDQHVDDWPLQRCRGEVLRGKRAAMNHVETTQLLAYTMASCGEVAHGSGLEIAQGLNASMDVRWAIHCLSAAVMERKWLHFLLQNAIDEVWDDFCAQGNTFRALQRARDQESERSLELFRELQSCVSELFGVPPLDESWTVWTDAPVWAVMLQDDIREVLDFYPGVDRSRDIDEVASADAAVRAAEAHLL